MLAKELKIYEIIRRKKIYVESDISNQRADLENVNRGEIRAYTEMLKDIPTMKEREFIEKYLAKLYKFEGENTYCKNIPIDVSYDEEIRGYNYGIIYALILLNPEYDKLLDIYI